MQSHQTDETTQADGAVLSEQELSSVSGGQFTPQELQHVEQITKSTAQENIDWRPLLPSAVVGYGAGFATHAGGETLHNKIFNKKTSSPASGNG